MWPLTQPAQFLSGSRLAIFFSQLCPFTCRRICIYRVPNLFTIGPAVWHLSNIFEFVTPKPPSNVPWGSRGWFFVAYFHSLVNLYTCAKFGPDRSSGLEAFPALWIDDPLTPRCPSGIKVFFSSCPLPDEYAYVCQIWSRSVQLFAIVPTFLYVLLPNPLQIPLGAREVNFSRCPFPD